MKQFTSKTQKKGEYGEQICTQYLKNSGFTIIERNYTERGGEIDIITKKGGTYHFIEVKSVSCETTENFLATDHYNPAENVHKDKIRKCWRTIKSYVSQNNVSCETQFDVYLVYIDERDISHKIIKIENVF